MGSKATEIVGLVQNSPEWYEWRQGKASASNAAVIMDACPDWMETRTWEDLRLIDAGFDADFDRHALARFEHGHALEDQARQHVVPYMRPVCLELRGTPFAASIDAYDEMTSYWAEIKCPQTGTRSKLWQIVNSPGTTELEDLPEYIQWQLVHQYGVIDDPAANCRLIVFIDHDHCEEVEFVCGSEWAEKWKELRAEWDRYLAGEAQHRTDAEWAAAVARFKAAKQAESAAKKAVEDARADLIRLAADGTGSKGLGVAVIKFPKRGNVQWKKVINAVAPDAVYDEDDYRQKTTEVTQVREVKT